MNILNEITLFSSQLKFSEGKNDSKHKYQPLDIWTLNTLVSLLLQVTEETEEKVESHLQELACKLVDLRVRKEGKYKKSY